MPRACRGRWYDDQDHWPLPWAERGRIDLVFLRRLQWAPQHQGKFAEHAWTELGYNGDPNSPTFTPSVLARGVEHLTEEQRATLMASGHVEPRPFVCHSFVTTGRAQYLGDCTHYLKGADDRAAGLEEHLGQLVICAIGAARHGRAAPADRVREIAGCYNKTAPMTEAKPPQSKSSIKSCSATLYCERKRCLSQSYPTSPSSKSNSCSFIVA